MVKTQKLKNPNQHNLQTTQIFIVAQLPLHIAYDGTSKVPFINQLSIVPRTILK